MRRMCVTVALISVMLAGPAWAIKFYQDINMQGTNLINAGGNQVTNVAAATEGHMAVNLDQLTNIAGDVYISLDGLSNYIANIMITNVANYAYLTNQVDDTYVNVTGDTMTGPLVINNDLTVNGTIYAETSTLINVVVSNTALFATNLTLQGVLNMCGYQITNVGAGTRGDMAVNLSQLTNAIAGLQAYLDGATNQTLIDARYYTRVYTDAATNAVGATWDDRWVNEDGDDMTGILGMGGQNITNLAPATRGDMAVNLSQLTNAAGDVYNTIDGLSNYIANAMITNVANYTYLTNQVDDTYVNVAGDTMTGPLAISNNLLVTGTIKAGNIYAETSTIMNIVVSNTALFATNLTLQGVLDMGGNQITNLAPATRDDMAATYGQLTSMVVVIGGDLTAATNKVVIDANNYITTATNAIGEVWDDRWVNQDGDDMTGVLGLGGNQITNLAPATRGDMAVNYNQLTNSMQHAQNNVTLQKAYDNGNSIATTVAKGPVNISGNQALNVTSSDGVNVNGGNLKVSGSTTRGVNLDGATGNEAIRLNADGKMVIYSGGSIALEFE